MTDQIDRVDDIVEPEQHTDDGGAGRRRRLFLTGAGIAGAAALAKSTGVARAADGDPVLAGSTTGDVTYDDGGGMGGTLPSYGETQPTAFTNEATDVDLAAPVGSAVRGYISETSNGAHALFGATMGAGHSVAGDTPADAEDGSGGPNTTAATWGRHQGEGAGIGGVSTDGYGGEFIGGKAHIRLIQVDNDDLGTGETAVVGPPTAADDTANGYTRQLGEMFVDGNGVLYLYTGSSWVSLTSQQVGFSDAQRAFDSRDDQEPGIGDANKGRISAGETVTVDLSEYTDLDPGAPIASISVTVTATDAIGFLTIFNGDTADADRPTVSQVTWGAEGTRTTNSFPASVGSDGTIKVYCGEGSCHFVVDVSG